MQIIRAGDCRTMPWKNGGGSTTEIAAGPPGASLDGFDWRISMARVASDGPFSHFAGIDRTLAVVDGGGMELVVDGQAPVVLSRETDPLVFPGDVPVSARLRAGAITDLNVMTRRGRYTHQLLRLSSRPVRIGDDIDILLVLVLHDGADVEAAGTTTRLGPGDALILRAPAAGEIRVASPGAAAGYLVLLREVCA